MSQPIYLLFLIISQVLSLKIPLYNFKNEALPFAMRPLITDKVTAAQQGYYGKAFPNATAEEMGVENYKDFKIDQILSGINGPNSCLSSFVSLNG